MMQADARRGIDRARRVTDRLFECVHADAYLDRPIPERHRILFYLGHLEAFDWNLVGRRSLALPAVDAALDDLFAFGIDPPPGELPSDRPEDWPSLEQTRGYARQARARVDQVIERAPAAALDMAVEHRLMHAETFSYILHNLPLDRRIAPSVERRHASSDVESGVSLNQRGGDSSTPDHRWIGIPAGEAVLGRRHGSGFGWDNEFGECRQQIPDFAVRRYKVTNAEYLEFVEAGGASPFYWSRRTEGWAYRGMWGEQSLPLHAPVYVTHEQAAAFAAWRGARLPTEAQFQRAAFGAADRAGDVMPGHYPWGTVAPTPAHGAFDFNRFDPVAVTATPAGDSAFGVAQLVGNGWEWTRTVFAPFPGFDAHPAYAGYSANFFDGEHYVLKGASPVTDRALLRPTFRNWFRPQYPYVYATFRLVEE
jgi:formylglycine-generating enzyme required for sulfatase activity